MVKIKTICCKNCQHTKSNIFLVPIGQALYTIMEDFARWLKRISNFGTCRALTYQSHLYFQLKRVSTTMGILKALCAKI